MQGKSNNLRVVEDGRSNHIHDHESGKGNILMDFIAVLRQKVLNAGPASSSASAS